MLYSQNMDTDKLVFGIIGGITLLITGIIIATSFSSTSTTDMQVQDMIGTEPNRMGPENARLTIVEFSDFECPFCAQYAPILTALSAQYPNDLAIIYRHYPLPSHAGAIPAARASEAAAKQGKFWQYADELFANQPNFTQADLETYAQTVGLNLDQFKNDFESADTINRVQEDADYGRKLNLQGTPTFYAVYDGKVEQIKLQQYSDVETKVKSVLGEPTAPADTSEPIVEENGEGGPTLGTQIPTDMPANLPTNITLDIVNTQRKGSVAPSEVNIVSAEKAEWSDASLGCPKEGISYAQVIITGYKVMAEAKGETFEYHTNEDGENVIFCAVTAQ